jgi:hypothetical protein
MPPVSDLQSLGGAGAVLVGKAMTPHEKAWRTRRKRQILAKVMYTEKWSNTMTRWLVRFASDKEHAWRCVTFEGTSHRESRGIVDMLAIRKDHRAKGGVLKRGDLFEIILIQVKGGAAGWPHADDLRRLRVVQRRYGAKTVVLSRWRKATLLNLYSLKASGIGSDAWSRAEAVALFK